MTTVAALRNAVGAPEELPGQARPLDLDPRRLGLVPRRHALDLLGRLGHLLHRSPHRSQLVPCRLDTLGRERDVLRRRAGQPVDPEHQHRQQPEHDDAGAERLREAELPERADHRTQEEIEQDRQDDRKEERLRQVQRVKHCEQKQADQRHVARVGPFAHQVGQLADAGRRSGRPGSGSSAFSCDVGREDGVVVGLDRRRLLGTAFHGDPVEEAAPCPAPRARAKVTPPGAGRLCASTRESPSTVSGACFVSGSRSSPRGRGWSWWSAYCSGCR